MGKHVALSTRFKDVYDLYYIITKTNVDIDTLKQCLNLLISKNKAKITSIDNLCQRILTTFKDNTYLKNIKTTKDKWIDGDIDAVITTISEFINDSINK